MSDNSEAIIQKLRTMQAQFKRMPYNHLRVAMIQEALAIAEQHKIAEYQIGLRYDLMWAYTMGDDRAKALPICAEYFALREQRPDICFAPRTAVSAARIAAHVAISLPQITLEQCHALMEQFHTQVRKYGLGARVWHIHACHFYILTGDLAAAEKHLESFRTIPRDDLSDCPACEASNAAEALLNLGRREEAMETFRPVLEGKLTCECQPWSALSLLIHDDLNHGNLGRAQNWGQKLARCPLKSPVDLLYVGALTRLCAYTDPSRSVGMLEKYLPWISGLWDQDVLFAFYRGAWALCEKLGETQESLSIRFPQTFPLYNEDGTYSCARLAEWFYTQAQDIAKRFDRRNGSNYYERHLIRFGEQKT